MILVLGSEIYFCAFLS